MRMKNSRLVRMQMESFDVNLQATGLRNSKSFQSLQACYLTLKIPAGLLTVGWTGASIALQSPA